MKDSSSSETVSRECIEKVVPRLLQNVAHKSLYTQHKQQSDVQGPGTDAILSPSGQIHNGGSANTSTGTGDTVVCDAEGGEEVGRGDFVNWVKTQPQVLEAIRALFSVSLLGYVCDDVLVHFKRNLDNEIRVK
uniref:Glutamate 5-kinase n=1 Tax=Lygus hesperus TaxID=30085 RepID=A0A0A9Y0J2_LYGHE